MIRLWLILLVFILISSSQVFSQPENQTVNKFEKEVTITLSSNYLLYLPRDYQTQDIEFPLVLFLHGSGERGNDIEKVKTHGPPKLVNEGTEFPFILVSPQCPDHMFWNVDILSALLDEIEANYKVDKNRIYLTGLSMGGHGTWNLALHQPDRFAAIAPVCGWSNPEEACRISHIPAWVFHGAKDFLVPLKSSEEMVNALKECEADVQFTVYPDVTHDSWTETYNNEEFYNWLLEQSINNDEDK